MTATMNNSRVDPRAARLRTAAQRLSAAGLGGPQAPRLALMASTEPTAWTEEMIESAAAKTGKAHVIKSH
ncbi:MAG: hypothetical protein L0H93_20480, partial [Nocardioides sp.]|nr:hypothetical protein [Nocardioides sp.]